jgi:hypothetical protein
MNLSSVILLIIFSIIIIIPTANAQTLNEDSSQKSIQVTIGSKGEMHAVHVIGDLDVPSQIDLIDGIISNLSVKDQEGESMQYGTIGDGGSLMILPSNKEVIIEYDIEEKLILIDNVWTLDFFYLDNVSFIFPQQVDLIFVNEKPAYLGEKKGILCHGCQMILEYSLDEPKFLEKIKIQDSEFLIEIRSWDAINQFSFDPALKGINFEVLGKNSFVTAIVPIDFLAEPYQIFLDEEKILFQEYINNETHVWLTMRPQNSGEVSIIGTVVPESDTFSEDRFAVEYVVIGVIIVGIVIVGVFIYKRKK